MNYFMVACKRDFIRRKADVLLVAYARVKVLNLYKNYAVVSLMTIRTYLVDKEKLIFL